MPRCPSSFDRDATSGLAFKLPRRRSCRPASARPRRRTCLGVPRLSTGAPRAASPLISKLGGLRSAPTRCPSSAGALCAPTASISQLYGFCAITDSVSLVNRGAVRAHGVEQPAPRPTRHYRLGFPRLQRQGYCERPQPLLRSISHAYLSFALIFCTRLPFSCRNRDSSGGKPPPSASEHASLLQPGLAPPPAGSEAALSLQITKIPAFSLELYGCDWTRESEKEEGGLWNRWEFLVFTGTHSVSLSLAPCNTEL